MQAYSQDLRERVVRACDERRGTRTAIAALFGVSTAWIRRLLQRRRQTGTFAARPHAGGPPPKMDDERCQRLIALVSEQPDATLAQLRDRLGTPVHLSTVARALARLRWTVKKKVLRAAEQDRPDVRRKRRRWRSRTTGIDPNRFLFLDEMGAHTALTRLYGRAPRGERLVGSVPLGRWQMTTLISAIRRGGVLAPFVFTGATDEMAFRTYVEAVLVPVLRPGDIVVLDRLPAHRVGAVGRAIRKVGASVWYLPPYSPDCNPIENIWSKVKAWLRQAAARTTEALWEAMAGALRAVTAQDCQNSFAHCGYSATPVCEAL